MSRRVYVYDFLDVNGDYEQMESDKNLTETEWQVLENRHNIDMLNKRNKKNLSSIKPDPALKSYLEKSLKKPPMRDPIKKRR